MRASFHCRAPWSCGFLARRSFFLSTQTPLGLRPMQNPLAQEFEAASAIPLPFQQFQAMHLALRLAVAPLQGEARFHRIVIFFQSGSKALELWDAFFFHPIEPLIQALALL